MRKRKIIILIFFLMILIFSLNFCSSKNKNSISEKEYKTIYNPMYPNSPSGLKVKLQLIEEISIGVEEGNEEYMFSFIPCFDVDGTGRIYVVDARARHIRVFDKNGKYLRTIGRRGQGPGEFNMPWAITITPQGKILVLDSGNYNLQTFNFEGELLNYVKIPPGMAFTHPEVDSKGNIINLIRTYIENRRETKNEIIKFKLNSNSLKIPTDNVILSFTHYHMIGILNQPSFIWQLMRDDNIIWGYSEKYELNITNQEGKIIKKIVKEYKRVKINGKTKNKLKARFPKSIPLKIEISETLPAFRRIYVDDENNIYVLTSETMKIKNKKYNVFDIFNSQGIYLTRLFLRSRLIVVKNKKLYAIETTDNGFNVVKRYKMIWK